MTYEQAYKDRQYLWKRYGPAHDMTRGYVDQEDLESLLKSPTKGTALNCLHRQIEYFFEVGPEFNDARRKWESEKDSDPRVQKIEKRWLSK